MIKLCFSHLKIGNLSKVLVTPDGKFIVSCGDDKVVKIFDLQTKLELSNFRDIAPSSLSLINFNY